MQVKFFWKNAPMRPTTGFPWTKMSGENAKHLEDEINTWLSQNPQIRIVDVKQSASGGSLADSLWLISVCYEAAA